ncbi:hypothetical protein C1Y63_08685 [Corynebacterium sp. 13CS0277]|uniref:hypothetical protein n=1 Tax=Corynebacterium sp. 13CS0277 TaxID=2071994 RepID=UPI000D031B30|nr:hypothetical protein [Corynebacterium sp. 13CS0277]PRQ10930.1 hypothetical protein C1Y63_08685 [Corynebacterium sp. 13CS0277]
MTTGIIHGHSTLQEAGDGGHLRLAVAQALTPDGPVAEPRFFRGIAREPHLVAAALRALGALAGRRYTSARGTIHHADPIISAQGDRLRIESFSLCTGVYARLDVFASGFNQGHIGFGTTNVDIGPDTQAALAQVRPGAPLAISVGADALDITAATPQGVAQLSERQVRLPPLWLKALGNTSEIAGFLQPAFDAPPAAVRRFVASLPSSSGRRARGYLSYRRGALIFGARQAPGAVEVVHHPRLEILRPFVAALGGDTARAPQAGAPAADTAAARPGAQVGAQALPVGSLRVYGPEAGTRRGAAAAGVAAVELALPHGRLTVMLSPGAERGFSGEGSLLTRLAQAGGATDAGDVARVHEHLAFDARLEVPALAAATGLSEARVRAALLALQTSGKVGWDMADSCFFHRELPYDEGNVAATNPRLKAAEQLLRAGAVHPATRGGHQTAVREFAVRGDHETYRVLIPDPTGDAPTDTAGETDDPVADEGLWCNCQWFRTHGLGRGTCKHILAATLFAADEESNAEAP